MVSGSAAVRAADAGVVEELHEGLLQLLLPGFSFPSRHSATEKLIHVTTVSGDFRGARLAFEQRAEAPQHRVAMVMPEPPALRGDYRRPRRLARRSPSRIPPASLTRCGGGACPRRGSSGAPQMAHPAANAVTRSPQRGQMWGPWKSMPPR